ncbi:MAG: PTS sugar transporter subunit IIA [Hespellia sp.]|nr:PTS sugar transporter subunit IIA [Hespellia sp.]
MGNRYLIIHGSAATKEEAIRMCGQALYHDGIVSKNFAQLCIDREQEFPTGLPTEIPTAIPHAKDEGIVESCICFLKLDKPVTFRRMDDDSQEIETDMIFNLAIKDPNEHLAALQNMMSFLNDPEALSKCNTLPEEELVKYLEKKIG